MAGMTSAGLAAMVAGEGWHYVGESGEPAFGESGDWSGGAAFRIREAGILDISCELSHVSGAPAAGSTLFTLPEGYRPSVTATYYGVRVQTATDVVPGKVVVLTTGDVLASISPLTDDMDEVNFIGQFFLDPPDFS